jgi:threonine/homoserine/homoserine lactone efflux protein
MTQPKTSVAKHAASSTSSDEHQPSKESNAAHMTVAVIAVTSGVIVLVALSIFVVIARARQRGMFQRTWVRCQSGCVGMLFVE